MRRFTMVQLSDLHLTGDLDKTRESLNLLSAAVKDALKDTPTPRILVITGDLVDSPTSQSLKNARAFVDDFSKLFEHTYVILGNHDVKRFFGSFSHKEDFNQILATKHHLLLRDIGLHLIGLDSTDATYARGGVNSGEYDKFLRQYYEAEERESEISAEERAGLIRIVAVHHHPLPLAQGEGYRILGVVKDESLMYLESPAQMLDACIECNVSLILHGHRHVEGLARYSVQSSEPVTSNAYLGTQYDESWKTIYVLSCPSSTGKECDAGFNILEFNISTDGAFVDIGRYRRNKNKGPFKKTDTMRPSDKVRLIFSRNLVRDVAIDVEAALSRLPQTNAPEQELFPLVANLFSRRAFMLLPERHWGQLFYATMKTRVVWQYEVQKRLRPKRQQAGASVLDALIKLEEFVAYQVLEMDEYQPDNLRVYFMNDKTAFLQQLPVSSHSLSESEQLEFKRGQLLNDLKTRLSACGISTVGFGSASWGEGGED